MPRQREIFEDFATDEFLVTTDLGRPARDFLVVEDGRMTLSRRRATRVVVESGSACVVSGVSNESTMSALRKPSQFAPFWRVLASWLVVLGAMYLAVGSCMFAGLGHHILDRFTLSLLRKYQFADYVVDVLYCGILPIVLGATALLLLRRRGPWVGSRFLYLAVGTLILGLCLALAGVILSVALAPKFGATWLPGEAFRELFLPTLPWGSVAVVPTTAFVHWQLYLLLGSSGVRLLHIAVLSTLTVVLLFLSAVTLAYLSNELFCPGPPCKNVPLAEPVVSMHSSWPLRLSTRKGVANGA